MIPYATQSVDQSDVRAVQRVMESGRLTQGPMVDRFEEAFAKYCGAKYAVAVSSGTGGLHLAALAAGLGPGDEALTSPMTFAATSNSALYCGTTPRFADIERDTLGLDPKLAVKNVHAATRALLPVHFAGQPCRLKPKSTFSRRKDFFIIEDAAHALGAETQSGSRWKKIGSCENSDMAVFSFHPVKHITTGEGGMITTNRSDLYRKLRLLRTHGIEKEPSEFIKKEHKNDPWYYEMKYLGFNYRITDIQCALGLSQLRRLDSFLKRRREIAGFYSKHLKNVEFLRIPKEVGGTRSSHHLYVVRIDYKGLKKTRAQVMKVLQERGIGTQVHYVPVYRQPYYENRFKVDPKDFPEAEAYYAEALSIPLYSDLKPTQAMKVVHTLRSVLGKA
jgi:perosamine synthetase